MSKYSFLFSKIAWLLLIAAGLLSATQCRPPSRTALPDRDYSTGANGTYTLSGGYGTLVYEGKVVRTYEQDQCIVRIPNLRLTFNPEAITNRTDRIEIEEIRLVATKRPPSGEGTWTGVSEAKHSFSAILTEQSPSVTLTDIVFTLRAEDVSGADHLGLAVTDGKLLWPIGCELK